DSAAINHLRQAIERAAPTGSRVLITGPAGSGKEVAARMLHKLSHRATQPFVVINCATMAPESMELELFGAESDRAGGEVTPARIGLFEQAHMGTLLLDEIGDMPMETQGKIVRALQEQTFVRVGGTRKIHVDVRVVATTTRDLKDEITKGRMREDLYYRLNTISIDLPALRHRREDIPLLAAHFLDRYATGPRSHLKGFEPEALDALRKYHWPGNVRELENTVERAAVLARGDLITLADLRLPASQGDLVFDPDMTMKEVERRHVLSALDHNDGNVSETAKQLGVSRRWLHYRLKEWKDDDD
ncbi:MAG: sigma-54 dependent transcriptional regulator, partial [Rubricoccaceae bacterium]|nr:sigma-54 dependent transcriptional regulator [Rubricoccaceae bacterium]